VAYNTEKLFSDAIAIAKQEGIYFVEDIIALLPCSKPTFYAHFPDDSNELNALKEQLAQNKVATKVRIRMKLEGGEKAAELIALYKLIASDDERRALSMTQIDHTNNGKEFQAQTVIIQSTGEAPEKT
jgi:hypothetical protein